jgi:single-strand DNA-binding protein
MFNSITAIGHLAADPTVRNTQSGKTICSFRICISDKQAKTPLFINVDTWDKTAEVCGQYLQKGRLVSVSGELQDNSYTNKEGQKVNAVVINGNKVKFLSSGEGKPSGGASQRPAQSQPANDDFSGDGADDDDIPF